MKGLMHNIWFRLGVPFLAGICVLGFGMAHVPEENLTVCSGKVNMLLGDAYSPKDANRPWRSMLVNSVLVFGVNNCSQPCFSLSSVSILHNPLQQIGNAVNTSNYVTVWFNKHDPINLDAKMPHRIAVNGKIVFDYWDFIHLYDVVMYPIIGLSLLWCVSMALWAISPKKDLPSFQVSSKQVFSSMSSETKKPAKQPEVKLELFVFRNAAAMAKGMLLAMEQMPKQVLATWFQAGREEMASKLGLPIGLLSELHKSDLENATLILAGHHPSFKTEQAILASLGMKEVKVYTHLEDSLMQLAGTEHVTKLMDKLGMGEDEVLTHQMITESVRRMQQKIDQMGVTQLQVPSLEEWLKINQINKL